MYHYAMRRLLDLDVIVCNEDGFELRMKMEYDDAQSHT